MKIYFEAHDEYHDVSWKENWEEEGVTETSLFYDDAAPSPSIQLWRASGWKYGGSPGVSASYINGLSFSTQRVRISTNEQLQNHTSPTRNNII